MKSLQNLKGAHLLSKKEQQSINGGVPSGTCAWEGAGPYYGVSGVSKDYAEGASIANGGNWCCDSCCGVGWLSAEHKTYLGCINQ